jgi:hypothetical protein
MKNLTLILIYLISVTIFGQKTPEDFGYKYLKIKYKTEIINVIIQSKKGDENKTKPLFFWCQGSLPQPVIKYNEVKMFHTFPFDTNDFLDQFHLVIIGKPGIPIISEVKNLKENYCFLDDSLKVTKEYSDKNYLDYYYKRNNFILKKLLQEKWVSSKIVLVGGHSEGSYVAAKMASTNKKITHLIYAAGNPYGRFLNILAQSRYYDSGNKTFEKWKVIVANKNNSNYNGGDTYKNTYDFSKPLANELFKLKIPVLFSYGTKDWSTPYNDLFYTESVRKQLTNFTFLAYVGLEHNYFPVNDKLEPNYEIDNWEKVGKDWLEWLNKNN